MRRALLFVCLAGCQGLIGSGGTDGGGDIDAGHLTNLDVYRRLKSTCQGCHNMDTRPFFADVTAFENLIVYDPKWVRPGDPDGSALVGLMTGTVGRQMPPAPGDSFKVLDEKGRTLITLAEIREWIRTLPARSDAGVDLDPVQVRRKSAEMIRVTLYDQLGLTEADFFAESMTGGSIYRVDPIAGDAYAVRSSDGTPYSDEFGQGNSLYTALGGAYWLEGKLQNDAVTPNMLQALVPVSQAWCRCAVTKAGNTAVLPLATLADTSGTPAGIASIKANIGALYLRMLGEPPTAAEIDNLYGSVFVPYEPKGTTTAWTAVCSALVRDPLWILY